MLQLGSRDFIFLDGAQGTMLQGYGLEPGRRPDILNLIAPQYVEDMQRLYADAGSDLICTDTFGCNRRALAHEGKTPEEVITAAVAVTKRACGDRAQVLLDVGPIGEFMEPVGDLTFREAYEMFREQAVAGEAAGAAAVLAETMSQLQELRAAILAVRENTSLPVIALMTFTASGCTYTGCAPECLALTAKALGAAAAGLNCSLPPAELVPIASRIAAAADIPLCVKPNAGMPADDGTYRITPEQFAESMAPFAALGVKLVGGCCGTTPDFIRAIRQVYSGLTPGERRPDTTPRICSQSRVKRVSEIPEIPDAARPTERDGVLFIPLPDDCTDEAAFELVSEQQGESELPACILTSTGSGADGALRAWCGVAAIRGPGSVRSAADRYGAVIL